MKEEGTLPSYLQELIVVVEFAVVGSTVESNVAMTLEGRIFVD